MYNQGLKHGRVKMIVVGGGVIGPLTPTRLSKMDMKYFILSEMPKPAAHQ